MTGLDGRKGSSADVGEGRQGVKERKRKRNRESAKAISWPVGGKRQKYQDARTSKQKAPKRRDRGNIE